MTDFQAILRDALLRCADAREDRPFRFALGADGLMRGADTAPTFRLAIQDDGVRLTSDGTSAETYLDAPGITPDQAFTPLKQLTGIAGWRLRTGECLKRRQISLAAPGGRQRPVVIEGRVVEAGTNIILDLTIRAGSGRVGLVIGRFQPPHLGHVRTIEQMLAECDTVIVCVGSTQLKAQVRHPLPWEVRKQMLERLFGPRVRMLPLVDIDSLDTKEDWLNYVLGRIRKQNLPEPTDFYAGSIVDARWYGAHFAGSGKTCVRNEPAIVSYEHEAADRRLHIAHDPGALPVNATDLRTLIELRDPDWRSYVPEAIHDLVERHYPGELRLPIRASAFPEDAPIGTRVIRTDQDDTRYVLASDGRWRQDSDPEPPQAARG